MRILLFFKAVRRAFRALDAFGLSLPERLTLSLRFAKLYRSIESDSILREFKLASLYFYLRSVAAIQGSMAELGVYRGGTAKLISLERPDRKFYLFDTFEGMPDSHEIDVHVAGEFADTSFEHVRSLFKGTPSVIFRKGYFPATAVGLEHERFSFVHLDGDLYQSTLDGLDFFYPRMNVGGVILIDDYEWRDCPGVRKACDEFFADKKEKPFVKTQYQAVVIKQ